MGDPRHSRDPQPGVAALALSPAAPPAAETIKNPPDVPNETGPLHALNEARDGCAATEVLGAVGRMNIHNLGLRILSWLGNSKNPGACPKRALRDSYRPRSSFSWSRAWGTCDNVGSRAILCRFWGAAVAAGPHCDNGSVPARSRGEPGRAWNCPHQ